MTPNPGSDEAVAAGCTCPVMDNARGRGIPITTDEGGIEIAFWMSGDCPLHGIDVRKKAAETNQE